MSKAKTNIRKAINYWTVGGFEGAKPVCQAIDEVAAMGFDGLELCFGAGELDMTTTQSTCDDIKACAKDHGIEIPSLATGAYWDMSLTDPKKSVRQKAMKFTEKYIEVAAMLGVKKILVVPGATTVPWEPDSPVVPYKECWKLATQAIRKLAKVAEKHKVVLCLENVWNRFLLGPMEMKAFIDQFGSRYVGSYFDVGNCILTGEAEHWMEILGRRIKAIHFKNVERSDCGGTLHGFGDDILKGDVNYPAVMKQLKAMKWKGCVTAEMIPFSRLPDLVLPDMKLVKDTCRKMDKILAM